MCVLVKMVPRNVAFYILIILIFVISFYFTHFEKSVGHKSKSKSIKILQLL